MFRVIIFDLIGILSEHKNIYSILKKITNYKGTVKSLEAKARRDYEGLITGNITELDFWNSLKKATNSKRKINNLKKDLLKEFKPEFDYKLFKEVKKYFKTALCTDFVNSWWLFLKNKFRLKFDYVVLSSSLKVKKPDETLFLNVPNFFKVKPSKCVYVSDERRDLTKVKKLGMKTVFIPGKTNKYREADYIYNNLNDFLKALI